FLATEILLVGHDCGGLFRELESRGQLRLVGIVWCVIEGTAFDVVSHASRRSAGAAAVQVMEPSILGEQSEVRRRALEVVVVHFYEQHIRGRVHQPHHDFRDDAALTEAPEHSVEQIVVTLIGARHDLAVAGHHLKLLHVVDLKTKVIGGYAKSAGADRSTDRQKRIGDHRHRQFVGVRRHHVEPAPISAITPVPDLTMRMAFRLLESTTTPPATWVCPKNECLCPRIATLSPWRFANCTSFAMSCASRGRTMAIGFLCTTCPKSSDAICKAASSKDNSPLRSLRSLRRDCAAAR